MARLWQILEFAFAVSFEDALYARLGIPVQGGRTSWPRKLLLMSLKKDISLVQ